METRLGRQVPTKSYFLCDDEAPSHGDEAIEFYEQTGRKAQPWQKTLMHYIFAHDDDGIWLHSAFGYSIPRRNGKSEILTMIELWALLKGLRILHTAHRTTTSTASFERLHALILDYGLVEGGRGVERDPKDDGKPADFKAVHARGSERVNMVNGGVCHFRTRTVKGGLGEGYDVLIIDEAQEFTDDQDSTLKYTISDSPNPLKILTGTPPTPISAGTVFMKMRNDALLGALKYTGWAEWSVDEMSDVHNIDLWYQCNPAMGFQLNERKVEAEIGTDVSDFNIQRLGLWLQYNLQSVISEEEWGKLQLKRRPKLKGKLFIGVKFGKGTPNVAMAIAVKTDKDQIFVESVDIRSVRDGDRWIIDYLQKADWDKVIIDGASGQQLLSDDMKAAKLKKPILPTVKEIVAANAAFESGMYSRKLCHMGQKTLFDVATNCEKRPIGNNGGFGYKSLTDDYDIALLDAVILAYWACSEAKPRKQTVRV